MRGGREGPGPGPGPRAPLGPPSYLIYCVSAKRKSVHKALHKAAQSFCQSFVQSFVQICCELCAWLCAWSFVRALELCACLVRALCVPCACFVRVLCADLRGALCVQPPSLHKACTEPLCSFVQICFRWNLY